MRGCGKGEGGDVRQGESYEGRDVEDCSGFAKTIRMGKMRWERE